MGSYTVADFENWATSPRAITIDDTLAFESPIPREACETWRAAAGGAIPTRSRFSARAVKNFVGNLVIFERQGEDVLIRLMGTRVSAVIGEMQGKCLRDALPPEAALRWLQVLDSVLAAKRPTRIVTTVNFNNLQYLEAEIFLAPLADEDDRVTMIFSAVVFRSGVAKSPSVAELLSAR
jgi:Uncharacterized protein conserved in bacteria